MKEKHDRILDRVLILGKIIQILLFACVFLVVLFTFRCGIPRIDTYKEYLCYDYHLVASDMSDEIGKYTDNPEGETTFYYYKIKDESAKRFIATEVVSGVLYPSRERYVLQNPEKYLNIRKKWSIKEIQIHSDYGHNITLDRKTYGDFIDRFYDFINSDLSQSQPPSTITSDPLQIIKLQIIFEESDAIVWETEVWFSDVDGKQCIKIDIGTKVDIVTKENAAHWVQLADESELYKVLSELFDERRNLQRSH